MCCTSDEPSAGQPFPPAMIPARYHIWNSGAGDLPSKLSVVEREVARETGAVSNRATDVVAHRTAANRGRPGGWRENGPFTTRVAGDHSGGRCGASGQPDNHCDSAVAPRREQTTRALAPFVL